MEADDLLTEVIAKTSELEALHSCHFDVSDCRPCCIDDSYINFLDEQIRLGARGEAWTARLSRRRTGLAPHRGVQLLSYSIHSDASDFTVYVDPHKRSLAFWEEYQQ